ncbi:MAG: TonB-dependent receptor plug domain-containing protein, partial [Bacteroidaceae bacterium]|nr:TonB-dependent receptor plug domain-containing protein [Bacteroidaceae bacterium]
MQKVNRYIAGVLLAVISIASAWAQTDSVSQDTMPQSKTLHHVTVKARQGGKSLSRVTNTDIIGQGELIRAACCNLGESFTTNPSVDVSYSDAASGARQIKLLGLSGTYVQMLTENMPNLRGASIPYSLGYVPGPWMQSIQVSKGASSVKNGYESITGQI